ncbi:DNA-7-methylguanine glycosylase [Aquimarina sp. MAR_2010_214]|uniref:DNA alkylation repair protein n=1 Tax=Aquimarina sp. MAR_2010_214 TaxID=1250026 RepID=UPI000C70297D|nr:DNA alkylation repair protein [Aquimarina sp. MAR_2010_214]PKV51769.1 DNA-7-methylguanine glycosylase [Aquimarina sp. MAR_2010_214]
MDFTTSLMAILESNANAEEAVRMEAYMKNRFSYYGIKAPIRKALFKNVVREYIPKLSHNHVIRIANTLYKKPKRELHYCAMELVDQFLKKKYNIADIDFIEQLITTNSWWDSVDFIAKHILGKYLLQFPDQVPLIIEKFSDSDNMWLNRSALLFQLGYKDKTDFQLLCKLCEQHKSSNEFFIKKAVGWALREYSKVNPEAVVQFVSETKLKHLSEKEALKRIK